MFKEDNLKLAKFLDQVKIGESSINPDGGREPKAIASGITKKVETERTEKNIYVDKHWDFYNGNQARWFIQRHGEDNQQFLRRKEKAVITNYIRFIVDLDTKFLYGRPYKIGRQYGNNKQTQERFVEINKRININSLMLEAKRSAAIFGEQGFRLIALDKTTEEQVTISSKMSENVYPHPVPLDPRKTFFLLNPYGKVSAVVIKGDYVDYTTDQKKETLELIVSDSRWYWEDDKLVSAEKNKYSLREEFILMKNNGQRIDNIQDAIPLQTTLNELITDNAYFFARHGRPQLVSSVNLEHVIDKDNRVWQVDVNDDENIKVLDKLGFLVWDGKMEAAFEHKKEIESSILKISSTAAISTGDLKGIGQLRSGAALITAHSPSVQKAQEQQLVWSYNEERFAYAVAAFDSRLRNQSVESRYKDLNFQILFPRDSGVPGEELMGVEIGQIEINSHLSTLEDKIKDRHPDFTDDEVIEYRDKIIADSRELADATRVFESVQPEEGSSGNGSSAKKSGEQKKSSTTKSI